jgi:hypothetical protein
MHCNIVAASDDDYFPHPNGLARSAGGLMSTQFGLFLLSHADMRARPDRTERALRVYFPLQADDYMRTLGRGDGILVRRGTRAALAALAGRLSAQGFTATVRALETAG